MRQAVSAFLTVLLTTAITAQAHDCTISESALLLYTHGNTATNLQGRESRDAIENLCADVADTDCKLPRSVTTLFTSKLTSCERRLAGGEALEHLLDSCPKGPSDHESRALFFNVVDLAFASGARAGEGISDKDLSEAAWEGANQFEFDLRQYMDRIVNEKDVEFKSVILKTANARAISRLGPDAKYDVLRMVHIADPARIGAGHHSAYTQAT